MTEPADGLRTLVDLPALSPEPVEELRRRVGVRRRRRNRGRAALGALAAGVVAIGAVPLLDRSTGTRTQVVAGPGLASPSPPTTAGHEFVAGQQLGTRLEVTVPPGWQTLLAAGERIVLATRPLSDADRALAELARNDVAFSLSLIHI